MRAIVIVVLALMFFSSFGCGKQSENDAKKPRGTESTIAAAAVPQTTCPIMGGPINKKYHADHDGKRVYFCCPACVEPFEKDPGKYVKQLEDQGVTLDKTPSSSD